MAKRPGTILQKAQERYPLKYSVCFFFLFYVFIFLCQFLYIISNEGYRNLLIKKTAKQSKKKKQKKTVFQMWRVAIYGYLRYI